MSRNSRIFMFYLSAIDIYNGSVFSRKIPSKPIELTEKEKQKVIDKYEKESQRKINFNQLPKKFRKKLKGNKK